MKETLKKIKENKVLRVIGNILYFLIIVIMQRVSDNSISLRWI